MANIPDPGTLRPVSRGTACRPRGYGCTGGAGWWLVRTGAEDVAAARWLHRRCSVASLRRRYRGVQGADGSVDAVDTANAVAEADRYLEHLLDPRHGYGVAARTPAGAFVGLGHLLRDGSEAEVTLLVADAWQRRGVGSAMLRQLLGVAAAERVEAVYAVTEWTNDAMVTVMRRTGLPLEYAAGDGGTLVLAAPLAGVSNNIPN